MAFFVKKNKKEENKNENYAAPVNEEEINDDIVKNDISETENIATMDINKLIDTFGDGVHSAANAKTSDVLKEAQKMIINSDVSVDYSNIDLSSTLNQLLLADTSDTISMFYDGTYVRIVIAGSSPKVIKKMILPDEYEELCRQVHIEDKGDFNCSVGYELHGVMVRAFALTKPVSDYPTITISTAKQPPSTWDQIEVSDKLDEIMKENWIVVGGSGAGKTYLTNYLLGNFHRGTSHKIGIIEEFPELFCPNEATTKIIVPPVKPGEESLLRFITEQSNLMRLKYLYVGEIKSVEAWPFVSNLSSGTKGGATMHGESADAAIMRLTHLCLLAGVPLETCQKSIARSINYVIHVKNHKIGQIKRLTGVVTRGIYQSDLIFGEDY